MPSLKPAAGKEYRSFQVTGSSIAQQERETIHQRQAEGIAAAKAKGKHLGRPRVEKPGNWDEVITAWKAGEITAIEAMRRTETKRSTFYKLVSF